MTGMEGIPDVQETIVVTQGSIVQPTDVVVTVQVGQTDTHLTPEIFQVSILVCRMWDTLTTYYLDLSYHIITYWCFKSKHGNHSMV